MLPDAAGEATIPNLELLPYACIGVALGRSSVCRALGPVQGLRRQEGHALLPAHRHPAPSSSASAWTLSSSAIDNCRTNWWIALVAILVVVVANIFGKGMIKIIPILLGVVASYLVGRRQRQCGLHQGHGRRLGGPALPVEQHGPSASLPRPDLDTSMLITAAITIMPLALATMVEHIGDMCAISSTSAAGTIWPIPACIAPCWATVWPLLWPPSSAAPANTTYGEKHRRAGPVQGLRPQGHPHRRRAGHPLLLQPQVLRPWWPPCPPPPSAASA